MAGSLAGALRQGWTPVSGASAWLFDQLHPPTVVQQPAPWPGNGGIYGSMPGGGSPTGTGGMMTVSTPSPFDPQNFAVICNLAVSCLLGVVGGVVAQTLHATQRDDNVSS